jgi:hypothetical protein
MAHLKTRRDMLEHNMPQMLCMRAGILMTPARERWVRRGARAVWGPVRGIQPGGAPHAEPSRPHNLGGEGDAR